MEGIITLIVIIIAFNIFNAIIRAVRGAQEAPQKRVFPGPEPPSPEESGYRWVEDDLDISSLEKHKAGRAYDAETTPVQETGGSETDAWQAPPPVKKEIAVPSAVSLGLRQALTRKDSLLAAFIFHEILERPPSLRRKR